MAELLNFLGPKHENKLSKFSLKAENAKNLVSMQNFASTNVWMTVFSDLIIYTFKESLYFQN